jgi:hypothetical protein
MVAFENCFGDLEKQPAEMVAAALKEEEQVEEATFHH